MLKEKIREILTPFWKSERVSPARIIIFAFLLLILLGAILLMLPFSTREGGGASFADALFTATSATCVTGLVVHDTAAYWSEFGQLVILLLIQVGGMGVVTMAVAIFIFSGKRIGLKQRWVMQESISAPQVGGIVRMTGFILKTAFAVEGVGALILAFRFCPELGIGRGLWYAVFHSISAFCNAGFDLMGVKSSFSSLTGYTGDPVVNITVMLLIVVGGLGFLTWQDISVRRFRFREYRLQSKLILVTTAGLLLYNMMMTYDGDQERYAKISGHGFRILAEAMEANLPYRLQCPALLICGEKDHAGSCIRYNKAWHERTGIPIRWLKNAGHNSNTDSPQMVNQILDAFLQKIKEQNP